MRFSRLPLAINSAAASSTSFVVIPGRMSSRRRGPGCRWRRGTPAASFPTSFAFLIGIISPRSNAKYRRKPPRDRDFHRCDADTLIFCNTKPVVRFSRDIPARRFCRTFEIVVISPHQRSIAIRTNRRARQTFALPTLVTKPQLRHCSRLEIRSRTVSSETSSQIARSSGV